MAAAATSCRANVRVRFTRAVIGSSNANAGKWVPMLRPGLQRAKYDHGAYARGFGRQRPSEPPGDRTDECFARADEPVVFHAPRKLLVDVPVEAEDEVPGILVLLLHGVVEGQFLVFDRDPVG